MKYGGSCVVLTLLASMPNVAASGGMTIVTSAFGGRHWETFAYSVGGNFDFNGDGYSDIVVGSPPTQAYGDPGSAYLYFGGRIPDGSPDLALLGVPYAGFGESAAGLGDVNGDGYDDLIIGAPSRGTPAGRAYVYFGGATPNAIADLELGTEETMLAFGQVVAPVGDVNADGHADFIVTGNGQGFLYFGGPDVDAQADAIFPAPAGAAGAAGDFDADGFDDLVICGGGVARVYRGGSTFDQTEDFVLTGVGLDFGVSVVSNLRDFNGDGFDDVAVGASGGNGAVSLFFGGPAADGSADLVLYGEGPEDAFGSGLIGMDFNGDGFSDLIVAAHGHSGGALYGGRILAYFGGPSDSDANWDASADGVALSHLGWSLARAGDFNGDGFSDFATTAFHPGGARALVYSQEVLSVKLDVQPQTCPNSFNLKSKGVLPAAILGNATVDAALIDPATIRLEGVQPIRTSLEDVGTQPPPFGPCGCPPEAADGRIDLTMKFSRTELAERIPSGTTTVTLTVTGRLFDGRPFRGSDCVPVHVGGQQIEFWKRRVSREGRQEVEFVVARPMRIELVVYDVSGRVVRTLLDSEERSGLQRLDWDASALGSGVYFYRLRAEDFNETARFVVVR